MRCRPCEALLDRYVDGLLNAHQAARVREHLRSCEPCTRLVQDLKSVDALLETSRAPELPPNFTFAVMADVRTAPAPRRAVYPIVSFLTVYLAAAWAAFVMGVTLSGADPRSLAVWLSTEIGRATASIGSGIAGVSHDVGHTTPTLAAFGFTVLAIEVAVACAFAVVYFIVRPRVAARLGAFSEAQS